MNLPRITIGRLMILVVIAALLLVPVVFLVRLDRALRRTYGPDGRYIGNRQSEAPAK